MHRGGAHLQPFRTAAAHSGLAAAAVRRTRSHRGDRGGRRLLGRHRVRGGRVFVPRTGAVLRPAGRGIPGRPRPQRRHHAGTRRDHAVCRRRRGPALRGGPGAPAGTRRRARTGGGVRLCVRLQRGQRGRRADHARTRPRRPRHVHGGFRRRAALAGHPGELLHEVRRRLRAPPGAMAHVLDVQRVRSHRAAPRGRHVRRGVPQLGRGGRRPGLSAAPRRRRIRVESCGTLGPHSPSEELPGEHAIGGAQLPLFRGQVRDPRRRAGRR